MKYKGRTSFLSTSICVIPRDDGDIVFTAKTVNNFDEFEKICKEPQPPILTLRTGRSSPDLQDKKYLKELDEYSTLRLQWLVLKSLEATEGLEWETVNLSDPTTWKNYIVELVNSGFSQLEVTKIIDSVMDACGLNSKKIDEARQRFLAERAQNPV